ncbi:MAG: hypothetical protein CMN25_04205 [Salinicola sp.]|uniref:hypothetical protein n=1 Tax=Salinicola sp. TaxID=1978524 RepID=UPI000C8E149C|nr:hypothetical protein [Salinicola sp.]MAM56518.1 hypothetical protein [Salinicola sp.]NRB55158.1 hypothetical protein [Salinicola sp.]|tara:strand:- start:498 stop:686 length:189 start_codon:yes stop_codon:yes gene_type:complete
MIITVGEFRKLLEAYDDQLELSFSGLEYHRLKQKGDKHLEVEFEEKVFRDKTGHVNIHDEGR